MRDYQDGVVMKRILILTLVVGVLVVSSLLIWPVANAASGEDPEGYISGELDKLGLDTGEIKAVGGDRYLVDIDKFDSRSDALTTTGKFRPCTLRVKLEKGKIQLERCGLEDAGLIPNTKQFPSSLKIEDDDIWGRPQ